MGYISQLCEWSIIVLESQRADRRARAVSHLSTHNLTVLGLHFIDRRAGEAWHEDDMSKTIAMNGNKDLLHC